MPGSANHPGEDMFSGEFARRKARRLRTLLDMERELERAMSTWESNLANLGKTEAALNGLFVGLSSLPGGSIPAAVREARSKSADAAIRAAYHQAKYQASQAQMQLDGYGVMSPALTLSVNQIWVTLQAISKAAGMSATEPRWSD